MNYSNDKQIYISLEMKILEIQLERGYASSISSTNSGEDADLVLW